MITFTLPKQLRQLAWKNQRVVYSAMVSCAWDTLKTFSKNDNQLQGTPGAIAVLHTNTRDLNFHPHVHVLMPAGAIDQNRVWRKKHNAKNKDYLFNKNALANVFRAKVLDELTTQNLTLPSSYPKKWIVHCKAVGQGEKAISYLGRYLYRGFIQEKNILECKDGNVTFQYCDRKTGEIKKKTLTGEAFLWRQMQHVLPKRFRRARNFGFLHPNSKRMIHLLQMIFRLNIKPIDRKKPSHHSMHMWWQNEYCANAT